MASTFDEKEKLITSLQSRESIIFRRDQLKLSITHLRRIASQRHPKHETRCRRISDIVESDKMWVLCKNFTLENVDVLESNSYFISCLR